MIDGRPFDATLARRSVRTCPLVSALWFLGAVMLVAARLDAQTLSGTLIETGTGAPVQGAAVVLLNRSGDQVAWRLTDAAGRFDFGMIRAGTYSLRADRIGHLSILSDPISVEDGAAVVYRLETPVEAIMLAGIDVASSRRCEVRPGQGVSTARVWEEARKALEATSRTSHLGVYRYTIQRYERELDARGRRVRSEQSRILRGQVLTSPFRSLDVEDLLENGFVRPEYEGGTYYAPDANVLLSDPFLDTHCMSLTEGEDEAEGLLGLSFQPTEDRGVPDISGVLWVDPEDAELRWLDYRYEFLDVPDSERLGGKIRFQGLPDGTWIVREWYIRMPYLETTIEHGRQDRTRLVGLKEEGGLVVQVSNLQGDLVLGREDSDPVSDAVVVFDAGPGVTLDDDGRVRITSMVEGRYRSRVFHPAEECNQDALPSDFRHLGILTGFAAHENGDPVPGARISVAWVEVVMVGSDLRQLPKALTTTARRDDGFFLICGIPRDHPVEISAEWNGIESRRWEFRLLRRPRVSRRDITIPGGR